MFRLVLILVLNMLSFWGLMAQRTMYVWAINGTSIYEKPSSFSKKVKDLKFAQSFSFEYLNQDKIKTKQRTSTGYILEGHWIKIKYKETEGYIFDNHFSSIKPPLRFGSKRSFLDYKPLLGKFLKDSTHIQIQKYNEHDYQIKTEIWTYQNGTEKMVSSDGCYDHFYTFNHLSLSEVYHLSCSMHCFPEAYLILPKFMEEQENTIYFNGADPVTGQITIRRKGKGWQLFSYDCH